MSPFQPRQGQRQIMEYEGGLMGVSAVPGSGKTTTIASLAARLIAGGTPRGGQILVVTYQNAAVDNVKTRIRAELEQMDLLQVGYDVRTLHSLSYGIIQANPGLAGTTADFEVLDERSSNGLLDKAVRIWNGQNPKVWGRLAPVEYIGEQWEQEWRRIARSVARVVVNTAKNRRLRPGQLIGRLEAEEGGDAHPLLAIGAQIYQLYQQQVETIGGVDFNDLVWMAVELLAHHPDLRQRLAQRWPVVLEDEAQDSVPLQEELLGLLTEGDGNWIRVGDPNQAIMSTFTAADPRYLRRFLERRDVQTLEMAISGRCSNRIIDLANHLVDLTCDGHPLTQVRQRAFRLQHIRPTDPGDLQQNPSAADSSIAFRQYNNRTDELQDVARRAREFNAAHPDLSVGILVPTNRVGYDMAEALRRSGARFDEMLQSPQSERLVTEGLSGILSFLAEPLQRNRLEAAFEALHQQWPEDEVAGDHDNVALLLRSCYRPETLLFPAPDVRPEDALPPVGQIPAADCHSIAVLARFLRRWLRASSLPVDQLIMTVGQDIMHDADLARTQKLAVFLRGRSELNLDWRLPELARELDQVARGRLNVLVEEEVFEPRPGRISLTTMHKAKGLEWDLVYLMGVDGDWFPHTLEDRFRGEYEFLGGDPAAEAQAALLRLIGAAEDEGTSATDAAHMEIIAERLRLLYVGITRARRYLALSWSREIPTGMRMRPVPPATVFGQLAAFYRQGQGV